MVRDTTGKHPQYYEAILQLRDIEQDIVDYVEKEIQRVKLKISKVVELKNGLDYYLSDNSLARALGKKLQTKFGGEYLVTASLFGQRKGKELYRVTILFRSVHFRKGDIVDYNGDIYQVKIMAKDVLLQDVKTGKKIHLKYKNLQNVKKQFNNF